MLNAHRLHSVVLLGVTALLLSLAVPADAAEPFGRFGGIVGGGTGGGNLLPLHGWCLDDDGVRFIEILVDDAIVGRASYGRARAGVAAAHPGFPDSEAGGFAYQLNTAFFTNGLHKVQPRCISNSGEKRLLNARTLEFTNSALTLVPFGKINFPQKNVELFGVCDLTEPNRRYSIIDGWALDAGVDESDAGMAFVELLIDGAIFANTRRDCIFDPDSGGLTNCYGLVRQDIERRFPDLRDSPNAGWRFALDVGALISGVGYSQGLHVLTVRASDVGGQVDEVDEFAVNFFCDENITNEGSFGLVGQPVAGRQYSGILSMSGWALDREGVKEVEVHVDGELVGLAAYGSPRFTVGSRYPSYPDRGGPGWSFALDTSNFTNGEHNIQVFVIDNGIIADPPVPSARVLIGERTVTFAN
ncbi:MAG: Ig-like domain-containing protein [Acidobacteriota bacterium]